MTERIAQDPWIISIVGLQFIASIAPWFIVIPYWRRQGQLLPYQPRRPVPWGAAGAMLAVAFTAIAILTALAADQEPAQAQAAPTTTQVTAGLIASMFMQLCGPALLFIVAQLTDANRGDLGVPSLRPAALARDITLGILVCLLARLPVSAVQIAMNFALDTSNELTKHPLVEMLTQREPEIVVLALATFMAVVIAPIGEEITFRLLLQGWLEKWEDRYLGWRQPMNNQLTEPAAEAASQFGIYDDAAADSETSDVELVPVAAEPPRTGIAGLPYGWTPILISSLLFAAAHYGYGPEPVPLFVLALALGYCYQKTHRIIPCIIAHALFNAMSMVVLWRVIYLSAGE